jgi:16S rRNA C1402 N4-methylase RsmH
MEVLYKYGDEKHGKLIAKKIIEFREIEFIKQLFNFHKLFKIFILKKKLKLIRQQNLFKPLEYLLIMN